MSCLTNLLLLQIRILISKLIASIKICMFGSSERLFLASFYSVKLCFTQGSSSPQKLRTKFCCFRGPQHIASIWFYIHTVEYSSANLSPLSKFACSAMYSFLASILSPIQTVTIFSACAASSMVT